MAGEALAGYSQDERKLVTVLLADVVGGEHLERTRAWLDRVREVASAEVEAAGGVIGPSIGGGILATFGAPNTCKHSGTTIWGCMSS